MRLARGVIETELGFPPLRSLKRCIPVSPTIVLANAFCCGPPYMASGKATCTGPEDPW